MATPQHGPAHAGDGVAGNNPGLPLALTRLTWLLFLTSLGTTLWTLRFGQQWGGRGVVSVDGLTLVMWVVVTFFSGIVHSFSRRYMHGDPRINAFFGRLFAFTLTVMALTAANHLALFILAWLVMGQIMAGLIGHVRGWPQAQAAARLARRYFFASGTLLALGLGILAQQTGATTITHGMANVPDLSTTAGLVARSSLLAAALVQSALFPFHRWLMSSMTAPTPASALMHAGFVNGGGFLLTRFAPLFVADVNVMLAIVVVGAISALMGQAWMLVQTDVKRKLASSTVAQMGFMILQCGLGFFAAAIAHLILHGFYKASLFLSSGASVARLAPDAAERAPGVGGLAIPLATAVAGGALFAVLTGKGAALNSGAFLTLVVALTALHAARDLLQHAALPSAVRVLSVPLVVLPAIGLYALLYRGVAAALKGLPSVHAPTELSIVHVAVAAIFVIAYVAVELDWHRASKRLYVALLNGSQPNAPTVLTRKEEYSDQ